MASERHLSVRETQQCVTSREFTDWRRYRAIEPAGPNVTAYQVALIGCRIINALGVECKVSELMIEPFEHAYDQAVIDGDLDDEEDEPDVDLDTPVSVRGSGGNNFGVDLDS